MVREKPEMVTDGVLVALFLLLLLVGLHSAHDGLPHLLRRLLNGGLQGLHEGGGALLLLCVNSRFTCWRCWAVVQLCSCWVRWFSSWLWSMR